MKLIVAALGLAAALAAGPRSPQTEGNPLPPVFHEPPSACGTCRNQPFPDSFCREVCRCTSAFCGSW